MGIAFGDVLGGAGGLVGGIIGAKKRAKAEAAKRGVQRDAFNEFATDRDEKGLTPQQIAQRKNNDALLSGDPFRKAMGDVPTNADTISDFYKGPQTEGRQASLQALQRLQDIGKGGMSPEEDAAMSQMRSQVGQQERGSRQASQQRLAGRGLGASGLAFAGDLEAGQQASDRASNAALEAQKNMFQRGIQATNAAGQLGQGIQGQDIATANAANQLALSRLSQNANINNNFRQQSFANRVGLLGQAQNADYNIRNSRNNARQGIIGGLQDQGNMNARNAYAIGSGIGTTAGGAIDLGLDVAKKFAGGGAGGAGAAAGAGGGAG